jgi:serine/threonine-protein kinase
MEAKVSARVNHPNIIDILDVGQAEDGTLFLVMELLTGVSLEGAFRLTTPMSIYELVGVMLDVARALYAAHSAGVIHRDLKPTNIYLHKDREGVAVPKLLDFGVSKFLLDDDAKNQALTVAGTVLGSPLYMSPEQAMGAAQIDGRTDIFAFGAIMFEGLTGVRCYEAPNFNALIVTIATTQPKSIDQSAPHLPAGLRQIVKDCLVTDRNKRISSFATIIERLNALLPELEKSPLRLPPPLTPGPATDPEDTGAMPGLVKPSDRPPPMLENAASPAGGFSAFAGPTSQRPPSSGAPIGLIIGGIVVMLAVIGMVGGLIYVSKHPHETANAHPTPTTAHSQAPPPQPTSTALELPDPPVVDISSLPSAKKTNLAPVGKGKLSVDMSGSWCIVKVDNFEVGPTPVAEIEINAGQHVVSCTPDGQKTKKETIFVNVGETKRVKFQ